LHTKPTINVPDSGTKLGVLGCNQFNDVTQNSMTDPCCHGNDNVSTWTHDLFSGRSCPKFLQPTGDDYGEWIYKCNPNMCLTLAW